LAGTVGSLMPNNDANQITVSGIYRTVAGSLNTFQGQLSGTGGQGEIIYHMNWNLDTQAQISFTSPAASLPPLMAYRYNPLTPSVKGWSAWQKIAVNDSTQTWYDPVYSNGYGPNLATSSYRLQYSKDGLGFVSVEGGFIKSSTLVTGEVVATIPAGFRPGRLQGASVTFGNIFVGQILIDINGVISWTTSNSFVFNSANMILHFVLRYKAIN